MASGKCRLLVSLTDSKFDVECEEGGHFPPRFERTLSYAHVFKQ